MDYLGLMIDKAVGKKNKSSIFCKHKELNRKY